MKYIGIDIGSTASKVYIIDEKDKYFVIPTGWNSKETAQKIKEILQEKYNINPEDENVKVVTTGYGRVSVPYQNKNITEITCHGKGASILSNKDNITVIDIGGQDTKVISVVDGRVDDFLMNDKCSAGTGRFIEIMADKLSLSLEELFELAKIGKNIKISSMCTVFAESEIISLMGSGEKKENIARGIISSVITKVKQLASRKLDEKELFLTGGLSSSPIFLELLNEEMGIRVNTHPLAKYAGALGAATIAKEKFGGL